MKLQTNQQKSVNDHYPDLLYTKLDIINENSAFLPVYWMEMFVCMEMEMLRPDNDFARASIKKAKTKVFLRLKCYSTSRLGKQNKISPVEILPRVKQDSHSQSWNFRIWQGGCSLQSIVVFNILYLAKTGAEWSLQPP